MKKEYINPFYKAAQKTFESNLNLDIRKNDLKLIEDIIKSKEINITIGITGDLSGKIIYCFPKEMSLEIVKIMSGMDIDKIDNFVTSAIGEIANIISGNAVTYLTKENYICNIMPPEIVVGKNNPIPSESKKTLVLSLNTALGYYDINISIKEA